MIRDHRYIDWMERVRDGLAAARGGTVAPRRMGGIEMVEIKLLVDAKNHLGEGPLWDVEEQRLYWIDSSAAEIWSCKSDGSDVKLFYVPSHIGSMALREKGGAVLA